MFMDPPAANSLSKPNLFAGIHSPGHSAPPERCRCHRGGAVPRSSASKHGPRPGVSAGQRQQGEATTPRVNAWLWLITFRAEKRLFSPKPTRFALFLLH